MPTPQEMDELAAKARFEIKKRDAEIERLRAIAFDADDKRFHMQDEIERLRTTINRLTAIWYGDGDPGEMNKIFEDHRCANQQDAAKR